MKTRTDRTPAARAADESSPTGHERRILLRAGIASLLAPAAAWAAKPMPLVDLMPDFWRAWDASRRLAADQVPAALISAYFTPHADVFSGAGVKVDPARVAKWIVRVAPHIAAMRRQSNDFRAGFEAHVRHFRATFPDFDAGAAPIYLMPSLGQFDGHLQTWGRLTPLFIGIDGLVLYHGDTPNLAVLLDHETFHLYHDQKSPGLDADPEPPLYVSLWKEGLATYVSSVLNPTASRLNVLLDDKPLDAATPEVMKRVAAEMLARIDSRDEADQRRYFNYGVVSDIPARSGYRVGLEVARAAARGAPLPKLARWDTTKVRSVVAEQLRVIATG